MQRGRETEGGKPGRGEADRPTEKQSQLKRKASETRRAGGRDEKVIGSDRERGKLEGTGRNGARGRRMRRRKR